jgi:two-component system, chemotaxis family, chemotaxis protein CheY
MNSAASCGALSVLIAEDNEPMRHLLEAMVRAMGVPRVVLAANGREALEQIRRDLPDLLIADWHMEEMTGVELARDIRSSEESPNPYLPIIMVTAYADKEHVTKAIKAGVHEILVKPVSPTALAARIREIFARPRGFVRTPTYFGPERRRDDGNSDRRDWRRTDVQFISPYEIATFVEELRKRASQRMADTGNRPS